MKRLTTVVLLCTLAVMTIFTATSCKGKTIFGSGIPKEPGDYLDRGNGWEKITPVALPSRLEEFDRVALPIRRGCQSIRYAYRFTPTEITGIGSFSFQCSFDDLALYPVKSSEGYLERDSNNALLGSKYDHSKYEGEDRYILIEYPLPDSPTGRYILDPYSLYYGGGDIGLRR